MKQIDSRSFLKKGTIIISGIILLIGFITPYFLVRQFKNQFIQYNYEMAGLLLENTPQTEEDIATIFTQPATSEQKEKGETFLNLLGYSEDTPNTFIASVKTYQYKVYAGFIVASLLISGAIITIVFIYFKKQNVFISTAQKQLQQFLDGDEEARLVDYGEGTWYRFFHVVNTLVSTQNAHIQEEKQNKTFLQQNISDISHQIKTPLAAIQMYNEIIQNEYQDPDVVKTFCQKIQRETNRIETLIQTLLKITKLDAGTIILNKTQENIAALLTEITERFELRAIKEQKSITLSGPEDVRLSCDVLWFSEAVGNLIKNALDYTQKDDKIDITWNQTPVQTTIIIKDTGKGIHPEDIHSIFKRFYRSKFSQNTQGLGLGLALSKNIIEAHEGNISVQSTLLQGTTFTLRFYNLTKL